MTTDVNDSARSNRKYLVTGAAVVAIAAGAYGLGRVYPPLGRQRAPWLRQTVTYPAR